MKRGQITILFAICLVAFVAVALLWHNSDVTGQAPLRTMNTNIAQRNIAPVEQQPTQQIPRITPSKGMALKQNKPLTEFEICMVQVMPKNQEWMDACQTDKQECLKTAGTEYCNYSFNYCMRQAYEAFVLQTEKCMDGMGEEI